MHSLEIQTLKVRDIIEDYRSGRLVIPEFQREYVWKKSRAPHLIDSIYRSFPISALLLWSSDSDVRSRRRDPRPARGRSISWLIDGQQRVITLSRILSGDEGTGFIADEVAPFVAELKGEGFSRLNVMHLFRACAFVALPDGRSRTPLHELSRSEVASAWSATKRATKEAMSTKLKNFGPPVASC